MGLLHLAGLKVIRTYLKVRKLADETDLLVLGELCYVLDLLTGFSSIRDRDVPQRCLTASPCTR